ncbi:MAG: NfeD family protein [Dehalococcoidales bacterium]|nr:NfeD family protein [Dehalococcoidales bacterium]
MRLFTAIITTAVEETALVLAWRWVLPYLGIMIPLPVLITVMLGWAGFAVLTYVLGTRALKKKELAGLPSMNGCIARVIEPLKPQGMVKIGSELWGAESLEGDVNEGENVTVENQEGLKLFVRRCVKR